MVRICIALVATAVTLQPALAATYPISGRWGVSSSTEKGPIDCAGLRVLTFNGEQRTDTGGGVPAYRNRTISPDGTNSFRIVDEFSTGQISGGRANSVLRLTDADSAELNQKPGGVLKLRKCK